MTPDPVPPPPKGSSLWWLRTWAGLSIRSRRVAIIGLFVVAPLIVVASVAALFSVQRVGGALTFDIFANIRSPFGTKAGAAGVIVAVVGWLLVPAVAALIVTAAIASPLSRDAIGRANETNQSEIARRLGGPRR